MDTKCEVCGGSCLYSMQIRGEEIYGKCDGPVTIVDEGKRGFIHSCEAHQDLYYSTLKVK